MERFSPRESILLGYDPRRSSTNPSTPNRNSDVDFRDVFGGPPRRSSLHETRFSLSELQDFSEPQREDEAPSCPWPPAHEKPVFGEDFVTRRRYPNNDFFDDIFGGNESVGSTPRKHERDPFSAAAGSRVSSPARPLPPRVDPFGASSIPATFSLPAKLTKGVDLPTFGSPTRSLHKKIKDGISNRFSSSNSPSTQGKEVKQNIRPTYRQSLLSHESSDLSTSDKADEGANMKQDLSSSKVLPSSGQFHFSIYKWATKEVPMVMPLRADRNSRAKEKVKIERSSSAKEWMFSERTTENDLPLEYIGSSSMKNRKQDDGSTTSTSTQNGADSRQVIKDVPDTGCAISCDTRVESSTHSAGEIGFSGKAQGDSLHSNETHKPGLKTLHSLFNEIDDKQDYDQMTRKERGKENRAKGIKKSSAICDVSVNSKIRDEKGVEVTKATSLGAISLDDNLGKGRVRGKVKEFVRIFNQEALTKTRVESKSQTQGCEYKQRGALRTKNEAEDYPEHSKKENFVIETTNKAGNILSQQDDFSASAIHDSSVAAVLDQDGSFHGNFLIKELAEDENEVLRTQYNKEIQVIDAKIQQWSNGKEGNIRSLLSTLQYVLWPESGWKPVPLVDIIEGNAVKRAYQRALLCLHPDKLQQKGAASQQKYIAEKVFDILQEAWTHFNMLDVH